MQFRYQSWRLWRGLVACIVAATIVVAPGGHRAQAQEPRLSLSISTPSTHFENAIQRGLYDKFFDGAITHYDALSLSDSALGLGSDGREIEARLSGSAHLIGMPVTWALALAYGESSYRFPDGIGIFRDSATLRLRYMSYRAELSRDWHLRHLDIAASAGIDRSTVDAHLRSALLDVTVDKVFTDGFVSAELSRRLGPAPGAPKLSARLTGYTSGMADLKFGLTLGF